jgi:hypothetical protein
MAVSDKQGAVLAALAVVLGAVIGLGATFAASWFNSETQVSIERANDRQDTYAAFLLAADNLDNHDPTPETDEVLRLEGELFRAAGVVFFLGSEEANEAAVRLYVKLGGPDGTDRADQEEVNAAFDDFLLAARADLAE